MCPRARTVPNTTILQHACDLLVEHGRDAVTFAQVAQRCGLAPPTLVQRFANRETMLAGLSAVLSDRVRNAFTGGETPLAALHLGLRTLAPAIAGALSLGGNNGLDQFSLELRKQISYALTRAVNAGELPHCDVAQLARTIQISVIGAAATARLEQGNAAAEISRAIDSQLASYV